MIGSSASRGRCQPINSDERDYSRITGRIGDRGPIVDVEVRLPQEELDRGRLLGVDPYRTTGIIDTGAERTCVQANIVDKLLLRPAGQGRLHSSSGLSLSPNYAVTLQLAWKLEHPPDPIPVKKAYALPEVLGAELLIGLDVLRLGEFVIYGPDNRYELILPRSTRPPS